VSAPEYPKIETLYNRGDDGFIIESTGRFHGIRCPEFLQIKHWLVTEKIDGTNIRVSLERALTHKGCGAKESGVCNGTCLGWAAHVYGRTDKAQIPTFLQAYLEKTFTLDRMRSLWKGKKDCDICIGMNGGWVAEKEHTPFYEPCSCVEPYAITLYGEGYGERIQKGGGNYREGVSFRLFDVLVGDRWWLDWENVRDVAAKLDIKTVPLLSKAMELEHIPILVQYGLPSTVAAEDRNGEALRESDLPRAEGVVARTDPYLYDKHGKPLRFKLKTKDFTGRQS